MAAKSPPDDKLPFPPGPYTEEQLQLLERGWHGRQTMQVVVAELRRVMTLLEQHEPPVKREKEQPMPSDMIVIANGIVDPGFDASLPQNAPPPEVEVEVCQAWLKVFASPTKTIRPQRSSYLYKHIVEHWTEVGLVDTQEIHNEQIDLRGRTWSGPRHYICNGAFIAAALREGYRVQRLDNNLNALFNMIITKQKS